MTAAANTAAAAATAATAAAAAAATAATAATATTATTATTAVATAPMIVLASVTDWPGFSRAVRHLHGTRVEPAQVRWTFAERPSVPIEADLFDDAAASPALAAAALPDAPALRLPRAFVEAAREVFLHAADERLPLLHRLAGRIADDARAWDDPLDADRLTFDRMLREVRREIHKMHAFVRFRAVEDADAPGAARHIAWFEPAHHVLEAAAPFFARRFATMHWAILTPRASVRWDGRALAFGPGAERAQAPAADAGEALWLAYYRSIFNPARVKVAMMKKEMPVRFWKNLPEAAAIGPLLAAAPERQRRMIAAGGAERLRRRGGARQDAEVLAEAPAERGPQAGPPADLGALRRAAARCRDCPVADAATQVVFGEGAASARLMIVGEQPGDQEDLRGRPFQGPAGQLLHAAIDELGWDAGTLYLTNAVKHFHHELRGKRRIHKTPGQREALACAHWLEAEIAAIGPEAIVALGATAARSVLGREVAVLENEGRWLTRADGIPVLVCRHPAAILRADPAQRERLRSAWIDGLRLAQEPPTDDDADRD